MKKKEEFTMTYVDQIFETQSSQDIAVNYSQLPEFARDHKYTAEKLKHRDKLQLANWRILKNVNDMLRDLQKDQSEEAYKQRVMLVASVICTRYGVPQVEETRNVIEEAKRLKRSMFTGEQSNLKPFTRKKKEVYPAEVHEMAVNSWLKASLLLSLMYINALMLQQLMG